MAKSFHALNVNLNTKGKDANYKYLGKKKKTRWFPCFCTLCGEKFDFLSHNHAETHGYKDAYEMIKDNVVKWS